MQLSPHLREQIHVVLFHPMTQERVNTGDLPFEAEIKDLVVRCSLFKPFLKKNRRNIPGLAGLQELAPATTRDSRWERSRSASPVRFAGFSATYTSQSVESSSEIPAMPSSRVGAETRRPNSSFVRVSRSASCSTVIRSSRASLRTRPLIFSRSRVMIWFAIFSIRTKCIIRKMIGFLIRIISGAITKSFDIAAKYRCG